MLNYQNPASPAGVARQRGNRNTRIENPPNTQSRVAANDQPSWQPTKASHAFGTPPRRGGKGGGGPTRTIPHQPMKKTYPQKNPSSRTTHTRARWGGWLVAAWPRARRWRRGGAAGVGSPPLRRSCAAGATWPRPRPTWHPGAGDDDTRPSPPGAAPRIARHRYPRTRARLSGGGGVGAMERAPRRGGRGALWGGAVVGVVTSRRP